MNIEDQLCNHIQQLEYSEKSKHIYTPKISLLLLQACPIIESYMVQLSTSSERVISHDLYSWGNNWKLWGSKHKEVTEKHGKRIINNFPKFSYVTEKVFSLSEKKCKFYYSDRFHKLIGDEHFQTFYPYKSLSSFADYKDYCPEKNKQFPVGLDTPRWWSAYNKIKHDMDEAEKRVSYAIAIEAISALYILLCSGDPEYEILKNNGYIIDNEIKSRLFTFILP